MLIKTGNRDSTAIRWFICTLSTCKNKIKPSLEKDGHIQSIQESIPRENLMGMPSSVQSVTQWCLTLCGPMNHSTPGLSVHHQLPASTQTHVHWVGDAIQPSHPLSSPSLPALNLSQHQGLFKWVSYSHQVAKVLEFQLQHQCFQWTPMTDFL